MAKIVNNENDWKRRARALADSCALDESVKNELFDLTWKSTVDIVIEQLGLKSKDHVFDAGFGWGRVAFGLKYFMPDLKIAGIELTPEFVQRANLIFKQYNLSQNTDLREGNILELSGPKPDELYDAIYSIRVFHYLEDKKRALKNLFGRLKKDGKIFISMPNLFCPYRLFFYQHELFNIFKLKALMEETGFKNITIGSYNFIPSNLLRVSQSSKLKILERFCQKFILTKFFGGLIFIAGQK